MNSLSLSPLQSPDSASSASQLNFRHLQVGVLPTAASVGVIAIDRSEKLNAFNEALWEDFPKAVRALGEDPRVRTLLLCANGRVFCSGIDTAYLGTSMLKWLQLEAECPGRMREQMRRGILLLQEAFTSLERFRWPVIAAVHGACIGGGVDLITACDIRVCSADATFCVKEADLGITADLGTLQRLPHIVGHGAAADLALTARTIGSTDALRMGLVSQVLGADRAELLEAATQLAVAVSGKPALALQGTKHVLLHARDNPRVSQGLDYVATWNAGMLISRELMDQMTRSAPAGGGSSSQRQRRPQSKL